MNFKIYFIILIFCISNSNQFKKYRKHFSLLRDFTCDVAKDELEKHPEMRTIAVIELEHNFPSSFSREVLQCLPADVAKVMLDPHLNYSLILPKETLVIYIADKVEWVKIKL